uniref:Rhodanese domain-containing protein n=1 Tax=Haptolina brevifila TaxID=156173 RepID=A0A7S2JMV4_9EUKA|mmetsp:Transcript_85891/g.171526  ORF Transcript_85891/g.171526 Transcript_85891/m.171526 type:complete len:122 (+) Transcript_85891:143-508(+)
MPWWWPGCLGHEDAVDGTDSLLSTDGTQILDVRFPYEFNKARLAGSKACPLLPALTSFEQRVSALALSPELPVVVVCQHAIRSKVAVKKLRQMGFSNVRELRGGMAHWLGVEGVPISIDGN